VCYIVRCDFFSHVFKDLNTPLPAAATVRSARAQGVAHVPVRAGMLAGYGLRAHATSARRRPPESSLVSVSGRDPGYSYVMACASGASLVGMVMAHVMP